MTIERQISQTSTSLPPKPPRIHKSGPPGIRSPCYALCLCEQIVDCRECCILCIKLKHRRISKLKKQTNIWNAYFFGPLAFGFLANREGSSDSRDFPLVLNSLCALSSSVLNTENIRNMHNLDKPLDLKQLQVRNVYTHTRTLTHRTLIPEPWEQTLTCPDPVMPTPKINHMFC